MQNMSREGSAVLENILEFCLPLDAGHFSLGPNLESLPDGIWNWLLYTEVREILKKEAEHSRWWDGSEQAKELTYEACLGHRMTNRSSHPPIRILDVFLGAFTGFSHVYRPDGLNSTLLCWSYVLGNGFHCGSGGQKVHPKDRGGREEPPVSWVQPAGQPVAVPSWRPPSTLLNQYTTNLQ